MDGKINDVELSCQGIDMLVNNDLEGCENLFMKHKSASPLMNYCASFISLMKAIMSFEEAQLEKASNDLETTIKLCSNSNKVLSSLKKAFSFSKSSTNSSSTSSLQQQFSNSNTLEDKFTKQIIIADCKLYRGILTFINQDVGSYLSNGILQLRSSWKMYSKIQKQLFDLFKKLEPKAEQIYGIDEESLIKNCLILSDDEKDNNNVASNGVVDEDDENMQNALNDLSLNSDDAKSISIESVKRLLGAVSFGFGMFQICISFLPPNILKLVKIFGFEGDRSAALKAISFTSRSKDMRAPFADMVLLWYETVAKQLFNLTEADVSIGTREDIEQIINKNLQKYPRSSLFLYFKGRYYRSVIRDLNLANQCFQQAHDNATQIRELQLIAVYELGWLHLMNLNYEDALKCFKRLSEESKWSTAYHKYVCALLSGSINNIKDANQYVKDALNSVKHKNNPIEQFAVKRLEYFKKNQIKSNEICEFLCVELNFLWVCLPYCEKSNLEKMLKICDYKIDKCFLSMKCLFEGALNVHLDNVEFGKQCFEEAIARAENEKLITLAKYALPFSYHQLALTEMKNNNYDECKTLLNKAKENFNGYDFENRLIPQIRSAQKKLKFILDKNSDNKSLQEKLANKPTEAEIEEAKIKEYNMKNFYI